MRKTRGPIHLIVRNHDTAYALRRRRRRTVVVGQHKLPDEKSAVADFGEFVRWLELLSYNDHWEGLFNQLGWYPKIEHAVRDEAYQKYGDYIPF